MTRSQLIMEAYVTAELNLELLSEVLKKLPQVLENEPVTHCVWVEIKEVGDDGLYNPTNSEIFAFLRQFTRVRATVHLVSTKFEDISKATETRVCELFEHADAVSYETVDMSKRPRIDRDELTTAIEVLRCAFNDIHTVSTKDVLKALSTMESHAERDIMQTTNMKRLMLESRALYEAYWSKQNSKVSIALWFSMVTTWERAYDMIYAIVDNDEKDEDKVTSMRMMREMCVEMITTLRTKYDLSVLRM